VFMPVVYHRAGKTFSSGYVVTACPQGEVGALVRDPLWKVLRNDTTCQAVRFADGVTLCAFWQPGSVRPGHGHDVRVDGPCLVLLSGDKLYVSNPAHIRSTITVSFGGKSRRMILPEDGTTVRDQF
jgi:hypothetical protein